MTMDVTVERARCCSLVLQVILGWPLVAKGAPWLSLQPTPSVMKHLGTFWDYREQRHRCCTLLLYCLQGFAQPGDPQLLRSLVPHR
jgi:hypothetical protein